MQYDDSGKKAFPRPADPADFLPTGSRVKLGAGGVLAVAGDEPDIGIIERDMHPDQSLQTVHLTSKPGTILAIAAGPIALGAVAFCAADGRVSATGTRARGVCLQAATAAGDLIEITNVQPPLT